MATSEIGSILVNILANTATFARDMDRANKKLDKFGKVAANTAKLAVGMFAGFSAARFINTTTQSIDNLGKVSDKLSIATERLQEFRYSANVTAGVMAGQFDTALQRMVRRLSEAANGTGEAVKALEELNLSATHLATLSTDERLLEIADAFRNVESEADQVRLAFKLFDTEGVALVNLLREGSAGIEAMSKRFRDLGAALSREDVRRIEEANDAFNDLKIAMSALGQSFLVKLTPTMRGLSDGIMKYLIPALKSGYQFWLAFGRAGASAIEFFSGNLEKSKQYADIATESFKAGIEAIKGFGKEMAKASGPQNVDLTAAFSSNAGELPIFEELEKQKAKLLKISKETYLIWGETMLSKVLGDPAILELETDKAMTIMTDYILESKRLADEFEMIWENAGEAFTQAIGDAIAEAIVEGKSFADTMKILARQVIKEVISSLIQLAIKRAMLTTAAMTQENIATANTVRNQATVLASATPAAAATSLSSFGANAIPAIAGILAVFALAYAITKRAGGGPLGAGQPSIVGEHGPEVFIPQGAGTVIPNSQIGGGGRITINNYIRAVDANSFANLLRRNGGAVTEIVTRAQNERGNRSIFQRR